MGDTGLEPVTPSVSCDFFETQNLQNSSVFSAFYDHSRSLQVRANRVEHLQALTVIANRKNRKIANDVA